ncbi:MAG: polyprenyl synthetase family protein [Bacteroidales bacterium]
MDILNEIKQTVSEELSLYEIQLAEALHSDSALLTSAVDYFLAKKGKNIRPILVLLAAKSVFGIIKPQTIAGAISLELLHNASIIHDDVVDDTNERRGRLSLNAQFSNKVAVLTGDFFLSTSLKKGTETENMEIMKVISMIGQELAVGEIEQLSLSQSSDISEERYYSVIDKKTASLMRACMKIGAISVCASEEIIEALTRFGKYLGLCFQIKDDIFDYFDSKEIGKPTGNDIREGKITLPLIYALLNAKDLESREEAMEIIRISDYSQDNIRFLIEFAKQNGGIDYAQAKMQSLRELAVQSLDILANSSSKELLIKLLDYVIVRNK